MVPGHVRKFGGKRLWQAIEITENLIGDKSSRCRMPHTAICSHENRSVAEYGVNRVNCGWSRTQ